MSETSMTGSTTVGETDTLNACLARGLERELARITSERDHLRELVRKLEEAGDAMERHIDNGLLLNDVTVAWHHAKEAKP